jgi:hypothetical protein
MTITTCEEGAPYKQDYSPSGMPWFWAVNYFPAAVPSDNGAEETREAAMAVLKASG